MKFHVRSLLAAAALALLLAPLRADALEADSADDVCAADADPCTVTEVVHVANGATLDFQNRTVNLTGDGSFDFGSGSGQILCGPFHASVDGNAIVAAGPAASGGSAGGRVTLESRRLCSGGASPRPCVDTDDCQLGACDVRRCTNRGTLHCLSDEDCAGMCVNRRCNNTPLFTRCAANADCDFGTCPAQLQCRYSDISPVACSSNVDCDFADCSAGAASISMGGRIYGNSDSPAKITLRAAESVAITAPVDLSSRRADADGGDLTIEAGAGDVTIGAKIRATGGGISQGGSIDIDAGQDISIVAPIDVNGGDYDGGSIDLASGRDTLIDASLLASSRDGAGYGGYIEIDAKRDFRIGGGTHSIRLTANGHRDRYDIAGAGGDLDFSAERTGTIASNVRIVAFGAQPDGSGGIVTAYADELTFDGEFFARARGSHGLGGELYADSTGSMSFGDTAKIDLRGGSAEGGGGVADLYSTSGIADISGTWLSQGFADEAVGIFNVEACRIRFAGNVENKSLDAQTYLTAQESIVIEAGSTLHTPKGENLITYRTDDKPPVLNGSISPAPVLRVYGTYFSHCAVCGNSEIDYGETCDDGNTADGDGCTSVCAAE